MATRGPVSTTITQRWMADGREILPAVSPRNERRGPIDHCGRWQHGVAARRGGLCRAEFRDEQVLLSPRSPRACRPGDAAFPWWSCPSSVRQPTVPSTRPTLSDWLRPVEPQGAEAYFDSGSLRMGTP